MELERQKKEAKKEKRQLESRALVAQVVATAAENAHHDDNYDMDESGGALNAAPDDNDDDDNTEEERDAWEMRELKRLLDVLDKAEKEAEERKEYERRKKMTDEERLAEDKALGLYQAPGESRRRRHHGDGKDGGDDKNSQHLQRYFHRGAFYMDKEEWDETDIRHKAKEYERAATLDDKVDKRNLPEVMQVKKFGFARQNTKYKGLSHEDTTDRKQSMLSVHNSRKHKKNRDKSNRDGQGQAQDRRRGRY